VTETSLEVPVSATTARFSLLDPDLDFRRLALEATHYARGFRLIDKDDLIGVPHAIVSVTYRPGFKNKDTAVVSDFVSVEAIVADPATLEMAPIKAMLPDPLRVYGNEPVVYNDGGTGIRRDLTRYFADMGLIDTGKGRADENPYDRPVTQWADGADLAMTGITAVATGERLAYICTRGLRKSEYENEYGDGVTFYIA
jgi:hypothetical protein